MERGGRGDVAAKRAKPSSGSNSGEDLLSALPDDILVQILLFVRPSTAAARTSVLSRRWRRVWKLLPELRVPFVPEPDSFRDALDDHEVPLQFLRVGNRDAARPDPESLGIWLPAAARRVSGDFVLFNAAPGTSLSDDEEDAEVKGAFGLPCFEGAESIAICLGFLGLALPPAGVFRRLTYICLKRVRFHGSSELGDAVSSPRCPCLLELYVSKTRGLEKLEIHSESLQKVKLKMMRGLRQLTVEAPALKDLVVMHCFVYSGTERVATISAPQLVLLYWNDFQDLPQLGQMPHLQSLGNFSLIAYGADFAYNRACLELLQAFQVIETLTLTLIYLREMHYYEYLMEDMKVLPKLTNLYLNVMSYGHTFGASVFHILRICTGIRKLVLLLDTGAGSEAQTACPSDCICDQPPDWKTEELMLICLREIEIKLFSGSENELSFVKRLFDWATTLNKLSVTFDVPITDSKAEELCQMFRNLSGPGACTEFIYNNKVVFYGPDED